jgi:hypothetical protein
MEIVHELECSSGRFRPSHQSLKNKKRIGSSAGELCEIFHIDLKEKYTNLYKFDLSLPLQKPNKDGEKQQECGNIDSSLNLFADALKSY